MGKLLKTSGSGDCEATTFPPQLHMLKIPVEEGYLVGRLFTSGGKGTHPTIVLMHGFPGVQLNYDLATYFQEVGYNVLVFHYRGFWGSKGKASVIHSLEDVETVLAYLRKSDIEEKYHLDSRRVALVGHSYGGFLTLMTAGKDADIPVVVAISCGNLGLTGQLFAKHPEFSAKMEAIFKEPATFVTGYSSNDMGEELMANSDQWNLVHCVPKISDRPVLLLAAENDEVNDMAINHYPLVQAFDQLEKHQMDQIIIEDTNHGYEGKRKRLGEVIANWLLEKLPV